MTELSIKDSIYTLCTQHPELIEILKSLGFTDIANPQMLKTVGRFMTLDKCAKIKNISLDLIRETLKNNGYIIV